MRQHFRRRIASYLDGYEWDGMFLCLRTQARPAAFADQFGFNAPIVKAMQERAGVDILHEDFDLALGGALQSEFFTTFLREPRGDLQQREVCLSVGVGNPICRTFATPWAVTLDIVPILLFIVW